MKYRFDKEHHVHLLDEQPMMGVSTVGSVLSKELTWWAVGTGLKKLGWSHPKYTDKKQRLLLAKTALETIQHLPTEEYLSLLDDSYMAHDVEKRRTAKLGTARHAQVELFVKRMMHETGGWAYPEAIKPFTSWAAENVRRYLWSEAHCWSEKLWVGGVSDIGAELKDGNIAVIDIKSSKTTYPSQFFQAGGYDLLISENGLWTADGERISDPIKITRHIIFPFGAPNPTAVIREDVQQNREAFLHELALYRQIKNYQ